MKYCMIAIVAAMTLPFDTQSVSADQPNQAAPPTAKFDLSHWKLTLPVDKTGNYDGHASEVSAAQLAAGFKNSHFLSDASGSLVFWCPVNGAKTEGTEFPRSELREMLDPENPSVNWKAQGTHILSARCRVTEVPSNPKLVIGQIHSYSEKAKPLVKLQYYKGRIEALVKSSPTKGKDIKLVWPEVGLGNDFTYQIKLQDGVLSVAVNGNEQTENIVQNDPAWADQTFYFKAGAYPQDNAGAVSEGAASEGAVSEGAVSEGARVTFSELKVSHTEQVEPAAKTVDE